MKKLLSYLMSVSIVFTLCACNDTSRDSLHTLSPQEKPTADTHANSPSEDLIHLDLEATIAIENEHARITETEIVKSLTADSTFSISLTVVAETEYVDYEYEVDMTYTKYDQGWMLDDAQWNTVSHQIARFPDETSMAEYVANYLPNHKIYNTYYSDFLLPIDDPYLFVNSDNTLTFDWTGTAPLLHAEEKHPFTTQWEYNYEIENWILMGDGAESDFDYRIEHNNKTVSLEPNYDLNFSGVWKGETNIFGLSMIENAPDATAEINISNFSWDKFDATFNYTVVDFGDTIVEGKYGAHYNVEGTHIETTSDHFVRVNKPEEYTLAYGGDVWYMSKDGDYIVFEFKDTETEIRYFPSGFYNVPTLRLYIKQGLPSL